MRVPPRQHTQSAEREERPHDRVLGTGWENPGYAGSLLSCPSPVMLFVALMAVLGGIALLVVVAEVRSRDPFSLAQRVGIRLPDPPAPPDPTREPGV